MAHRSAPPPAAAPPGARFAVEIDREADGRWIADVSDLPGCLVYGATRDEALSRAIALALHVLADRIEHGEAPPDVLAGVFVAAA